MPKKTLLVTLTVAVEASDEELASGLSELAQVERSLTRAVNAALEQPRPLGWQTVRSSELDPASSNCGRCTRCGGWVTDRDRPEPLDGLGNGARVDGQLLCDEHLPEGHRWAF
ncbi:hypothetical protein KYC5002_24435 [Archangium violaceum]|uniref:hypothetical protein n=1 Tax=Archangium violaceum TaxID=83451 RepID=UPI002B31A627|nr:hypothetical protein KYC5002_24435 [Archangium gephyra]